MFSIKLTSFRKNLGIATAASVISFVISLGLTPIMTRWYQPDDYGVFAVINNIATFVATAFLLSLPNALPAESSWHRRAQLLRALMLLAALAFLLSTIAVGLFLIFEYTFDKMDGSEWVFVTIPFLVLVIALHRIAQGWAVADGDFGSMAKARIIHPLIAKPFAILASILGTSSPFYMIFFEGAGYIFQFFTMVRGRVGRLKGLPKFTGRRRLGLTIGIVNRHRDYSLFLNLVNLLMLGFITLQTLIIANSYSVNETGLFALAMSMVSLPVQLVALATASVIYHQFIACMQNEPQALFGKARNILLAYMVLGIIPYLVIFIFGSELFGLVFGLDWSQSGSIATLLSLPLFLQFLFMPISSAFRVTGTIKLQFYNDLIFIVPTIAIFYLASRTMPFLDTLTVLVIAMSIHRFVAIMLCLGVMWRASGETRKAQRITP